MAEPTPKWSAGSSGFGIYELLVSWRQHRASFLISLSVTLAALVIYFFSFFGESPTEETSSTGFFNIYADSDGVIRRSNLIIPYGRSKKRSGRRARRSRCDPLLHLNDWDIYASLEVQTIRLFFSLPNEQVVLEFGPVGASRIVLAMWRRRTFWRTRRRALPPRAPVSRSENWI